MPAIPLDINLRSLIVIADCRSRVGAASTVWLLQCGFYTLHCCFGAAMHYFRFSFASLLFFMIATSLCACSAPLNPPKPIALFPGDVMKSNRISQTSTTSFQASSMAQTTLNLNSANLQQPHRLIIRSSGSTLTGQITLDGTVIQSLRSSLTEINLSPYLNAGQHAIEIVGSYAPMSANVQIEFVGPGTSVMQQTSGSGQLRQRLNLQVQ